MNAASRAWSDLTTEDFRTLDPARVVAVLPTAATEQHGPHLPVSTDSAIAQGMVTEAMRLLPTDLPALFLPLQSIGKSNEHLRSPGTLTLSLETAFRAWVEIGESVARAGVKKLVIVNAHGGNTDLIGIVARELRIRCGMLCVHTAWMRFGTPEGLYSPVEAAYGIHGGDVETSLMLHFRPDLVRMDKAQDFVSAAQRMAVEFTYLRPTGQHAHGWIAQDLNSHGVVGEAYLARTEKGRLTAEHQARGFVALLGEVSRYALDQLA